jgi:hypothetical protein
MTGKQSENTGLRAGMLVSERLRILAARLNSHGLVTRIVSYRDRQDPDDEGVSELVVVNPSAPTCGEIRIGDDGCVTWEFWAVLDSEPGMGKVVITVTAALAASPEAGELLS